MFLSGRVRFLAIFLSLVTAFSVVSVDTAEARRGGSFGSRGLRTFQTVPPTRTSPQVTAPVQKTTTNPSAATTRQAPAAASRGLFGGGLLQGLFLGGLFGLFLGTGFGGVGGMLSLLFQLALIGGVLWLLFGRRRMAAAGGPASAPSPFGAAQPRRDGEVRRPVTQPLEVTAADLDVFEDRLKQMQDAFSREDEATLRRITTPEMLGHLTDELRDNRSRGVRNEVFDVRMLGGSVAEAWSEGSSHYATVALRYESRDLMRDLQTGQVVSGSETPTETTEVWTFLREGRGEWRLSAIQEA